MDVKRHNIVLVCSPTSQELSSDYVFLIGLYSVLSDGAIG